MQSGNECITITLDRYRELLLWEHVVKKLLGVMENYVPPENPRCSICGARMLRWGWYEAANEPIKYWYCLECDKAGRAPYIQVKPNPDYILG
jgi:hypothetical protein